MVCDRAAAKGLDLHFTTNGKHLAAYRDEVALYHPSIQVTIDGFRHDDGPVLTRAGQRLQGLHEELLWLGHELGIRIYVRFLITLDTVEQFIRYADLLFASQLPESMSLGAAPIQNKSGPKGGKVPTKHEILAALLKALQGHDYAKKLAFTDWRSIYLLNYLRVGKPLLPMAGFYHCEAQTHLFAFGSDGLLYTCYEAGGDPSLAVGRYFPSEDSLAQGGGCRTSGHGPGGHGPVPITLTPKRPDDQAVSLAEEMFPAGGAAVDRAHLRQYRERTAFSIPQCSVCSLSPICGGGCQVRGIKKNGAYEFPYCDDLDEEVRFTMRNWPMIADMLLPAQWRVGT